MAADELLASLKEGTEAGNEDRITRGFPPLAVTGWIGGSLTFRHWIGTYIDRRDV